MDSLKDLLLFTRADSFGSLVVRGVIWLVVVLIIAAGIDNNKEHLGIKADLGWFFLLVVSIGFIAIFIFGFVPTF